jgi:hypothetical protein
MNLTEKEKLIIKLLLQAERSTTRFLTGFRKPSEKELAREKFLDNLIKKFNQ